MLAQQNTNIALRYATWGYIMKNGRIVLDGEARRYAPTRTCGEFYLGVAGSDGARSAHVKRYEGRKRWLA